MNVEMPQFEHDYYEILQVHPKATLAVIKKAYRTLMLEQGAHPDQGGSAEVASRITEAYKVLSNTEKRAEYDRWYMSRMGFGPQPSAKDHKKKDHHQHAAPKEPPKEAPKTGPIPQEPAAAAANAFIVLCPKCRTKNRVRSQELLAIAMCSKCGQHLNKLANPLLDLKEHVLAAVTDRLGQVTLPRWVKIGIPVVMIAASLAAIGYAFMPQPDPLEQADQLRHEKKFDQAADLLEKALDKEPGNPRLREKLGDVYTKQKLLRDALKQYEQAIELNPRNSYLYTLQGNTYLSLGQLAAAQQAYSNALKLDPDQDLALVNLGNVFARDHRYDEAEKHYLKALRIRENADVFYNLGMVYKWDNKPKQAIDAFRNALIADPGHRASMVSLAALYYEQHKFDLAAAQLVTASHLKHSDLDLHLRLADIYERTGRKQDAISEWQICVEQAKTSPLVLERAKNALKRLGVKEG